MIEEQFEALCRFVAEQKLGACVPNQCEVTYVNHIPWGREGQPPEDLAAVLTPWSGLTAGSLLGASEQVDLAVRYVIDGEKGPVGRLHVQASPGYRPDDQQPLLSLTLRRAAVRPVKESTTS